MFFVASGMESFLLKEAQKPFDARGLQQTGDHVSRGVSEALPYGNGHWRGAHGFRPGSKRGVEEVSSV